MNTQSVCSDLLGVEVEDANESRSSGINDMLLRLRDTGNTVRVVEQQAGDVAIADPIVDPGPGVRSHPVVFHGWKAGPGRARS